MSWQIYKVIFQVCSPLHLGMGRIGNLQRTRSYLIGRVLWGALTMRLTRDKIKRGDAAQDSREYQRVGEQVNHELAFTYFYPALRQENYYQIYWPWENETAFRYRFTSSYAGTALSYPQQSAASSMLWETEFISPNTIDTGEPVFLLGYIFQKKSCKLAWQRAIQHLQLGGERGYGWGDVRVVSISEGKEETIFDYVRVREKEERPAVHLPTNTPILAHTIADNLRVTGDVEPLIGREWRSYLPNNSYVGQYIAFNEICFTPGSVLTETGDFFIDKHGIWT